MLIDFSKMNEKHLVGFKGGEKSFDPKMFCDDANGNKIMQGRLEPGASIGYHEHSGSCEIIFILEGEGFMKADDGDLPVKAGDCHYCANGHSHSLINTGSKDMLFYAVVASQK